MENFLHQLNSSKSIEAQKEENKPYLKNPESNSNLKEISNKSNDKPVIYKEMNINEVNNFKSN